MAKPLKTIKTRKSIQVGEIHIGAQHPLTLIAGPCVIESEKMALSTAGYLKKLSERLGIPLIYKSSYDKANRTSIESYRGPRIKEGLRILAQVREHFDIPVLSDVHTIAETAVAGEILDVIQVPAFLCRQTDFILAAARTQKPLNIKKGQFLAPWDVANIIAKAEHAGNRQMMVTERGTSFGYNNLVVDMRSIKIMGDLGIPVIFDATHSVQLPGGGGIRSAGQREFAPTLARAAVAAGADGVFLEVHPEPENALCDGPNSLALDTLGSLLTELLALRQALEGTR